MNRDPLRTPAVRGAQGWRACRVAAAALGLSTALFVGFAGGARAAGPPPDGAAVVDRFVEATGGVAAYDSIQNRVIKGTLSLPAQNISLDMTQYQARPKSLRVVIESQVLGKMESGVTAGVAWENSAITGPRLKEGTEEQEALREATFDLMAHWRRVFVKADLAGADTVGGSPCWKVVLTPRFGRPRTLSFDQQSGLLQKMEFTTDTPSGSVNAVRVLGDYRRVGSILIAHRVEGTASGQKRVVTMTSVEQNVDLPAKRFDPPAEVQKLIDAKPK